MCLSFGTAHSGHAVLTWLFSHFCVCVMSVGECFHECACACKFLCVYMYLCLNVGLCLYKFVLYLGMKWTALKGRLAQHVFFLHNTIHPPVYGSSPLGPLVRNLPFADPFFTISLSEKENICIHSDALFIIYAWSFCPVLEKSLKPMNYCKKWQPANVTLKG